MKNIVAVLLALLMSLALFTGALAEDAEPIPALEGLVTELVEDGFIMEDKTLGPVMLNVDETTVMDGVLTEQPIEVGQYVFVTYDGRMTRSLPPQAHADRVGCYVLKGAVGDMMDIGFLLTGDELFGDVIVRPGENPLPPVYSGVPITVYYNGIMALSLPGQVSASHVVVPSFTGVVSEKDDEGFTLTMEDGESYRVLVAEETVIREQLTEDEAAAEMEADDAADDAEAELADEAIAEEETDAQPVADDEEPIDEDFLFDEEAISLDGEPALPPVEWGDGDTVTIYFAGVTGLGTPAQITALEVVVIR